MGENHYVLEYDFHMYTINMECKRVERKRLYFDKVEELLEEYRKKKMHCLWDVLSTMTILKSIKQFLKK